MNISGLELFKVRPYRSKRLNAYCKAYSQDKLTPVYDDNVAAMLLAQGYVIEDRPRSIYKVRKLYEALAKYAPGKVGNPIKGPWLDAGIAFARTCFQRKENEAPLSVLSLTPETVVELTSKPAASAGLTNFGFSKGESQTRALERGLQTLNGGKAPEPCIAYVRTQFNDKTRLVWGYPYSETVIEGLIAYPLIQMFKGKRSVLAFAQTTLALGTRLRVASYNRKYAYSIDMSSYDSSVSGFLIHEAFKILRSWYDLDEVEPVSKKSVREIFEHVEKYFVCTPIVMPDGKIYLGKRHGVPSGSYFTQLIDSIANVIIAGTIGARFNMQFDERSTFVLGDDILVWSDRNISLDKLASYATSTFGVKFNASKSRKYTADQAVHFLGRNWLKGVPDLELPDVLCRMVYPERFRQYPKDKSDRVRQVSLLLLSFAGVYRSAWEIAERCLSDGTYQRQPEKVEVPVYYRDGRMTEPNPEFLTGLQRYKRFYVNRRASGSSVACNFLFT